MQGGGPVNRFGREAVDGPALAMTYWEIGIGCRPAKRGEGDTQWRRWRFWVWVSWVTRWPGT